MEIDQWKNQRHTFQRNLGPTGINYHSIDWSEGLLYMPGTQLAGQHHQDVLQNHSVCACYVVVKY